MVHLLLPPETARRLLAVLVRARASDDVVKDLTAQLEHEHRLPVPAPELIVWDRGVVVEYYHEEQAGVIRQAIDGAARSWRKTG